MKYVLFLLFSTTLTASVRYVVFDIDESICWRSKLEKSEMIRSKCPECKQIVQPVLGDDYLHVFALHIEHVFIYLLRKGVRVAFFSAGVAERNESLIERYFIDLLGLKRYQKYLREGQFRVFSRQHLKGKTTPYTKDLSLVTMPGESTDNAILVEDDDSYAAKDQLPCLKGRYVSDPWGNSYFRDEEIFALNHAYYFLGVLDTCFEAIEKNPVLTLRAALINALKIDWFSNLSPRVRGNIKEDQNGNWFNPYPRLDDGKSATFVAIGQRIVQYEAHQNTDTAENHALCTEL